MSNVNEQQAHSVFIGQCDSDYYWEFYEYLNLTLDFIKKTTFCF